MEVHSIVNKITFDKILKVIEFSKKASVTLSVLLGILSSHSEYHLSSHSHLDDSEIRCGTDVLSAPHVRALI